MPTPRPAACPPSYSTAHLARRLGVSVPTVQRWVDLGHLKAWKTVGGHRRIDAESAEHFIREHAQRRGGEDALAVPFLVLVVDDDPNCRDELRALVGAAVPGARVVCAGNGFDALIEVGRATPDLIVVDVELPHLDGFEMIRHLCAPGEARPPVILALSAQPPAHAQGPGGLPPGVTLVAKPVDGARFVDAIRHALDGA